MADTPQPRLDTLEAVAAHLGDAFDCGDPARISAALAEVASAPAAGELAAAAGFSRHELQDAMSSGELELQMALEIMKVIDLHRP